MTWTWFKSSHIPHQLYLLLRYISTLVYQYTELDMKISNRNSNILQTQLKNYSASTHHKMSHACIPIVPTFLFQLSNHNQITPTSQYYIMQSVELNLLPFIFHLQYPPPFRKRMKYLNLHSLISSFVHFNFYTFCKSILSLPPNT